MMKIKEMLKNIGKKFLEVVSELKINSEESTFCFYLRKLHVGEISTCFY